MKCCYFSIAYVSIQRTVIIYYLFYFNLLYLTEKWICKQLYWAMNSFLSAPFESCVKKTYLSVMSCSCVRIFHYTSSILVEIMCLSQLFFYLKLQQNWMWPIITAVLECFYKPVSLMHMWYTSVLWMSVQQYWVSLRTETHCRE